MRGTTMCKAAQKTSQHLSPGLGIAGGIVTLCSQSCTKVDANFIESTTVANVALSYLWRERSLRVPGWSWRCAHENIQMPLKVLRACSATKRFALAAVSSERPVVALDRLFVAQHSFCQDSRGCCTPTCLPTRPQVVPRLAATMHTMRPSA